MNTLIIMQILHLLMHDFVRIDEKHLVNAENCIASCKHIQNAHTVNIYPQTWFTSCCVVGHAYLRLALNLLFDFRYTSLHHFARMHDLCTVFLMPNSRSKLQIFFKVAHFIVIFKYVSIISHM